MILSEPPRSPYDVHFRLFGVPVRIHPFFWLFTVLLSGNGKPSFVLIWLAAVVLSLLVHEFGHVFAFRRFGVDSYVVLHSFGGLAVPYGGYGGSFAPRLAPRDGAIVAFAGPAAEMLSAYLLVAVCYAAGYDVVFPPSGFFRFVPIVVVGTSSFLSQFVNLYVLISLFWALINLLPIVPLDGGRISQFLFTRFDPQTGPRQALILSIIVAGLTAALMFLEISLFSGIFFIYLAYTSYQALQDLGYGGRRW
ncbi:MAG: M50 family metallopeptidase [Planctomycetia bacterium]|nr:M50 family metallopeptidase [Planctomycetia bacterium]